MALRSLTISLRKIFVGAEFIPFRTQQTFVGAEFIPFRTSLKRNNTTRFSFLIGKDEHVGDRNVINHAPTRPHCITQIIKLLIGT
ncbi:hypothetical protein [Prevotella disiens]|uniref:hypothetical protein n=1 Tax=Prevotella disiens TaxID=28130 RepID=UPI0011DD4EDF|nr:hypothetical protein [Prevotella disiens]